MGAKIAQHGCLHEYEMGVCINCKRPQSEIRMPIIQDWVCGLGIRMQGTLMTGVRGCDTSPREGTDKTLARIFRGLIFNAHCGDHRKAKSFIVHAEREEIMHVMDAFIRSHDHLPHHYIMHTIHAWQIIACFHPSYGISTAAHHFYSRMCRSMHMKPETVRELILRLEASEEDFAKNQ